uniref:Uncharacterized protein n=1 Tax=Avena sativa TaxID=4498 RepID=A0ACD5ZF09_AVESA
MSLLRPDRGVVDGGELSEAVRLLHRSAVCPAPSTYALLLQECVNRKDAKLGKRIHARMVSTGYRCGDYIATKLLIFYPKIGELCVARSLFEGMPRRGVVAWNALISGCTRGRLEARAVEMFGSDAGGEPAAGPVHSGPVVAGNVFANSALVDMYLKCSSAEDARRAFAAAPVKNVTLWTAVISGHGQHGHVREALSLFGQMTLDGFGPNDVTFLALLSACAHGGLVDEGLRYFSSMPSDYGLTPKAEHYAAVVDMLARVGRLHDAI